jgi:hypothetical protein
MKTTIQIVKRWLASVLVMGFIGMSFGDEAATNEVLKLKERIRQLEEEKLNATKAFWRVYAAGTMDQAWVALNINNGTEKRLEAWIQEDLPQYVQAINTSPIKDEKVVLSALWMVKAYYEKSQVPIPEEIKATLAALPEKPPTSCQLRLRELEKAKAENQVLGDTVAKLETYVQTNGSGWSAVILVTNISNVKIQCVATSYPAGLPQGSRSAQAKELKTDTLPKTLAWTRREPESSVDFRLLQRYGTGQVFDLGPGEGRRLLLPIYVPQAHPDKFVEHFVFGYKRSSPNRATGAYETYVAEVKQ